MRLTALVVSLVTFGCSSSTTSGAVADAGSDDTSAAVDSTSVDSTSSDSSRPDVGPPPDTCVPPAETGTLAVPPASLCAGSLPTTFACTPPDAKAGSTACTEAMIQELVSSCFGSTASESACRGGMTKYSSCSTCMFTTWLYNSAPDTGACLRKIDPTSNCGTAWRCTLDCLGEVCGDCDPSDGSGAGGVASEMDDCARRAKHEGSSSAPKGACYDLAAKDDAACAKDCRFGYCYPRTVDAVINFYRGACRDGGDWTYAWAAL